MKPHRDASLLTVLESEGKKSQNNNHLLILKTITCFLTLQKCLYLYMYSIY